MQYINECNTFGTSPHLRHVVTKMPNQHGKREMPWTDLKTDLKTDLTGRTRKASVQSPACRLRGQCMVLKSIILNTKLIILHARSIIFNAKPIICYKIFFIFSTNLRGQHKVALLTDWLVYNHVPRCIC